MVLTTPKTGNDEVTKPVSLILSFNIKAQAILLIFFVLMLVFSNITSGQGIFLNTFLNQY